MQYIKHTSFCARNQSISPLGKLLACSLDKSFEYLGVIQSVEKRMLVTTLCLCVEWSLKSVLCHVRAVYLSDKSVSVILGCTVLWM